jgi:hypothetical protein
LARRALPRSASVRFARPRYAPEIRVARGCAGEVRAVQDCVGEVCSPEVGVGEVCGGEVCVAEVRAHEKRAGEVCAVQVDAGEVRVDEVCADEIRAAEVCTGEERFYEERTAEVRAAEVDGPDVTFPISAQNHGDGGLNLGPRRSFLILVSGISQWPWLAGVLADKRAEHLHHRRVISGGVAGDAFQCVDAADPDIELVRTELLDSLGVKVGRLPPARSARTCAATG